MAVGGYFARHIIVSAEANPSIRDRLSPQTKEMRTKLEKMVNFMLALDKAGAMFELSDEALKYYNEVVEREALGIEFACVKSSAGRYLDYVLAFADILLVSEALGELFNGKIDQDSISNLVELVTLVKLVETINETKYVNGTNPTNSTNLCDPFEQKENVIAVQKSTLRKHGLY